MLVNINKAELDHYRNDIYAAIKPCTTVLDDSIGSVLWFAARGKGVEYKEGKSPAEPLEAKSEFVLVGSGSDEQLGGYARFTTVFQSRGIRGIAEELSMEMSRIGKRNLEMIAFARLIGNKQSPFLEEDFVRFLNKVPPEIKTGFSLGKENKFLLRNALKTLAVPDYLYEAPKRAMQFGSNFKAYQKAGVKGSNQIE